MLVRYRYRIDPTPGQRQALARAFGCARVVYNDALAERRTCHRPGRSSATPKCNVAWSRWPRPEPERAWLGEVASVVLVQACQDARRAYRNWFDSRSGRRKGRRIGRPGSARKRRPAVDPAHPQRLRLRTGPGCSGQGRRPAGALVACVAVGAVQRHRHPRAGRPLLRLVRGRARPDPCRRWRDVGIDLGLVRFAQSSSRRPASVANPRHLRAAQRRLARAQRALSRKRKGSANRPRPPAGGGRAPQGPRRPGWSSPQARPAAGPREPSGRTSRTCAWSGWPHALAKSVHDAGWATLVRLLEEKAAQHGRRVVKVGRW